MFKSLIEAGRQLAAKNERYIHTDISNIPADERMFSSETYAWFRAAKTLITKTFGESSEELARWEQLQSQLGEKVSKEIQADTWKESRSNVRGLGETMGLLTEFQIYFNSQHQSAASSPVEIMESIERFQIDHPNPMKVVFIMMRFGRTKAHKEIMTGIHEALKPTGISALRADDKQYHDDLFFNILTYIYGCNCGIAVFERIESEQYNPNVAMEVGYMLALRKPVCLLKDQTLKTLQADLVGKLYRSFDSLDPVATIPTELSSWLRDKGIAEMIP